ncbi:MAG: aminodeoxychorismate synthase component I [Proteobacteria bacterium]|nr:aminodeoxychorismate synthase component I [Pseudomonadota bacterium]
MARGTAKILLDDARPGQERVRRYTDPAAIVQADDPQLVDAALRALQNARRAGKHVAGYFSYELGYVLEPHLRALLPGRREEPLLWFGIFDACEEVRGEAANALLAAQVQGRAYGGPLGHEWNFEEYAARFAQVRDLIDAGDIYQANLSFRSHFAAVGDPMALYLDLRKHSKAAHGAFIDDGKRHILSLSPELFFSVTHDGEITAKPMKGTAPRGDTPMEDVVVRTRLQNSEKDRAENLMIVDLLRNDMSRVSEIGSVSASDLYAIETFPTVHQMVSAVSAQLRPNITIYELVRALFPCGSVTGTPKIRAMQIIHALEQSPRGVYCGAIGHFAPDGSAEFNVAIRTLTIGDGCGALGIGGAVVHDSHAQGEYDECLLKARYYDSARQPLELIETLRFSQRNGFVRQNLHLARMALSATAFSIPFDAACATRAMNESVFGAPGDLRVRLVLHEDGSFSCSSMVLPVAPAYWRYTISSVVMPSSDILLRHKTNRRETYESEFEFGHTQGSDEVLFVNEHGRLTEGSRTNIFLRRGEQLFTPPLDDGVLNGCLRRELIAGGQCEEAPLYPQDLNGGAVLLGNSLRGLIKAVAAEPALARAR